MPPPTRPDPDGRPTGTAEVRCRRCRAYCDRVVEPTACLQRGCRSLYAYDAADGRRYAGCVRGVFRAEIRLAELTAARETGVPFGPLRCEGEPLPICAVGIDQAYPGRVPAVGCVNPEFAEPPGGDAFRVVARLGD